MAARRYFTGSPEETIELGRSLARDLTPPVVVLLIGDLGAGKTTLTKGIVAGMGAAPEEEVTSPTFTLVHEYGFEASHRAPVYHVDLYRIETPREMGTLALDDLIAERSVVIVEWGEKLGSSFRSPWPGSRVVEIMMKATGETERQIEVQFGNGPEPSGPSEAKTG